MKNVVLIIGMAFLASCGGSRHSQKTTTIDNWGHWTIQFKSGATHEAMTKALAAIEASILDQIDKPGNQVANVTFTERYTVSAGTVYLKVSVIIHGQGGTTGSVRIVNPGPLPKDNAYKILEE